MRTIATLAVLGTVLFLMFQPQTPVGPEATEDCPSMEQFLAEHPDATPEEIYEAERCVEDHARATGRSGRNTGFLGNTYDRPRGALAHYRFSWNIGSFTVFEDRIVSSEDHGTTETVIPIANVAEVSVHGLELRIDYTDERGHPDRIGFMLSSGDDVRKEDGARDIDRLRDLIDAQRAKRS